MPCLLFNYTCGHDLRLTIVYMCVFICVVYAMMPDEKMGELDAKGTKCLLLGYCEGTKASRLMCL